MIETLQDESEVERHLAHQGRMEGDRAPWEPLWREVDARVDPQGGGGFDKRQPSGERGLGNFDETATEGLDRFTAAIYGLTFPQRWHGLTVADKDLARAPAVARWLEHATDQLFACRDAAMTGFRVAAEGDVRQIGKYGTAPLWIGEAVGKGLYYRAVHLSEIYIDEDFCGHVDTVHQKFTRTARQARQEFGLEALPPRIAECLTAPGGKRANEEFEFLRVIAPQDDFEPGNPGPKGKPIKSLTIAIADKMIVRRGGFSSFPMPVSRAITSPGSKYGRSPAMKVIGSIRVADEIAKTMLRAAHKSVDPALAFFDDGDISRLVTKPGGLNPGLVDEFGRLMVHALPGGGDLSWGLKVQEDQRGTIRSSFLEEVFTLLTQPRDRMTATEVLEIAQKQGLLVSPYKDRLETEKLGPMVKRELSILLGASQIRPMPPEMVEAGAWAQPQYENGLARMARAEEVTGFMRLVQVGAELSQVDEGALDIVNVDRGMQNVADVLGVRPSSLNTPEEMAAKRHARDAAKQEASLSQTAPALSGAALDLAKANQLASAA